MVTLSEQDEIALGNQANQEVLKQYVIYGNPPLQGYVRRVGNKLAAQGHRSGLNYSFTVLDSKEVNAFALPSDYIYIMRGLMMYLNSETELAAVLSHEIGHAILFNNIVRTKSPTSVLRSVLSSLIASRENQRRVMCGDVMEAII